MDEFKKILIIDDVLENITILGEGLRDRYGIIAAKSGKKGLSLASSKKKPDLILLDIMMPEMDGYEVIKELKENEITRDIPVIFVSAMNEVSDKTKGFALGAVDYITKPFQLAEVRARINTHLELTAARITLNKQNQALLEAAALKDDVEHIIRHDLKAPLNSIIGIPQLLLADDQLNEEQKEFLNLIHNKGLKMLKMIEMSLDIFKMEKGIYKPDYNSIPLTPMFKKVIADNLNQIDKDEITVTLNLDDACACMGEEILCYSLFSNVIRNAVEAASPQSPILIEGSENEDSVCLSITNSGEVPDEVKESFFDKYVTFGKSGGTGLGTYSAALICRTLQGSIHLNSSRKGFTTIEISLPIKI
jgi:two-component system, sensor histidine kinase and response regulator